MVIIALPNILNLYRNARENVFVSEVKEIVKTANQQYISNAITDNECKCFSSKSTDKKYNLDMDRKSDIKYYIEFNNEGEIINLIVKDNNINLYQKKKK